MKKSIKLMCGAILVLMLAGCGNSEKTVKLSGNLKEFAAKNYTISLPEECSVISSEISDLSASIEECSIAIVSMPTSAATICESKKEFKEKMDAIGYNLEVKDYDKDKIDGIDVYKAEYILGQSAIDQYTYVYGDTAYVATYARPEDYDQKVVDIFEDCLKTLKVEEE